MGWYFHQPKNQLLPSFETDLVWKYSKCRFVFNEFNSHYVSVIYLNGTRYRIYLTNSGQILTNRITPLFPKGQQRVLCIVRLPSLFEQNLDFFIREWESAQTAINEQHATLAQQNGLENSLVSFKNDNYYVSQNDFPAWDPNRNSIEDFKLFAANNQIDIATYDILLLLDLDINNPNGGVGSWESAFAKVGWFYEDTDLSVERLNGIAYAAYHHEIGHVWGWEHEWTDPYDNNGGFITEPSLFGWSDINGNGVPEIIDENQY